MVSRRLFEGLVQKTGPGDYLAITCDEAGVLGVSTIITPVEGVRLADNYLGIWFVIDLKPDYLGRERSTGIEVGFFYREILGVRLYRLSSR